MIYSFGIYFVLSGTLDYLTLLERRAQRLKNIQKDFDERHVAVEDLQSRITELRARRDQLRKGLKEKAQSEVRYSLVMIWVMKVSLRYMVISYHVCLW